MTKWIKWLIASTGAAGITMLILGQFYNDWDGISFMLGIIVGAVAINAALMVHRDN